MVEYFRLAKILKPQGIKGEVKLKPYADDLSRFLELPHVYLKRQGAYEKREVTASRIYKQFAYIKMRGCDDRNTAETLRGQYLYIDREHAAKLPEGASYIADLIGLRIVDRQGAELGTLAEVIQSARVDIYSVEGKKNFLFPLAPGVVIKKDLEAGEIVVDEGRLAEVSVDA